MRDRVRRAARCRRAEALQAAGAVAGIMLLLASCSRVVVNGVGTFVERGEGWRVVYTAPAPLNDPAVQAVEGVRIKLQAPPPSAYVTARVDNRRGKEIVSLEFVSVLESVGPRVALHTPSNYILGNSAVMQDPHGEIPDEIKSLLRTDPRFKGWVSPGDRAVVVLVVPGDPIQIKQIRDGGSSQKITSQPARCRGKDEASCG